MTDGESLYQHPYPSADLAAAYPFRELRFPRRPVDEMRSRADALYAEMDGRRSVRMFSPDPVPRDLIEAAIRIGSTAPSGAHKQPWTFVAVSDLSIKQEIRQAAEEEERINYLDNRMNEEWQAALAPLGTDHHKEFLEIAPWLVVLFEQRFGLDGSGNQIKHYYVKESTGIAAGMFVGAIHQLGLATLPHTPSPMAFLRTILGRPDNERPFVMFPVGFPLPGVQVPDLERKALDDVAIFVESNGS